MDIKNVVTPASVELTLEAEKHVEITKDDTLLSIGCGKGGMEYYLAKKYGCSTIGMDINPDFIEIAKKEEFDGLKFMTGDCQNLSFADETFSVVYSCGALASFFDRGYSEIARVLKKNGTLILIEATYKESTIPQKILDLWERGDIEIPRLVQFEKIVSKFFSLGMRGIVTKAYYDPFWFELLIRSHDLTNTEIFSLYKKEIGVGLFMFQKVHTLDYYI